MASARHIVLRSLPLVLAALVVGGAGSGGFDEIKIAGAPPAKLAQRETMQELIDRVMRGVVPPDHIMTPPCGKERHYEFLPTATLVPADPLTDRYAAGEMKVYIIRLRSTGCGQSRIHNVYAFPRREPFYLLVGTPGETIAKLDIQLDVQRTLYQAVTPKNECADEALVSDTLVIEKPNAQASWAEIWTAQTCGVSRRYKISFMTDKSGVTYSIAPVI